MDPNINQPIGINPVQQPVAQSVPPTETAPIAPVPASIIPPEDPKGKNGKIIILLVILLLLVVGIMSYVLFARVQMDNAQKTTTDNSSLVLPTPTAIPTLTPEEDLEVASAEADLIDLEADVKGL